MTSNFCQHPLELQMLTQVKRLQLDIRFEIIPDSLPPLDADVSQFGTFSSNVPPVTRNISYGCHLCH
jgi:hypothetical protein